MELLHLAYFCDAAITQNFSKTTEKYNVPPANISQSIKRLEKELSAPLFDRRTNRAVVISAHAMELRGFAQEKLFSEDILLTARNSILPQQPLSVEDLQDKPFITMGTGNSLHPITENICGHLGFRPRIALQSEDPFYIRKYVELGFGIAFVPAISWRDQFSCDVTLHRVGDYGRDVFLYRKNRRTNAGHIEIFCRVLLEEIRKEHPEDAI